jgi:hypothetical protein
MKLDNKNIQHKNALFFAFALLATLGVTQNSISMGMRMTNAQLAFLQDVESGNLNGVQRKIEKSPEILDNIEFVQECITFAQRAATSLENAFSGESPKLLPGQPDPEWNTLIGNCREIAHALQEYADFNYADFYEEGDFFSLSGDREDGSASYVSGERHSKIHARPYQVNAESRPTVIKEFLPEQVAAPANNSSEESQASKAQVILAPVSKSQDPCPSPGCTIL